MDTFPEHLKEQIKQGKVYLYIGAGCSGSSKTNTGINIPDTIKLTKILAEKGHVKYEDETDLSDVYIAAKEHLGDSGLETLFQNFFVNCNPSTEYRCLSKYAWPRIYTTNIDDAFQKALESARIQNVIPKNRNDRWCDTDQTFRRLDYILLNGSARRHDKGYLFSRLEFAGTTVEEERWHSRFGEDLLNNVFIFLGSSISDPTFYHYFEKHINSRGASSPRSYCITSKMAESKKIVLKKLNIETILAPLEDFTSWLEKEIPGGLKPAQIDSDQTRSLKEEHVNEYLDATSSFVHINKEIFNRKRSIPANLNPFYEGFPAEWEDIAEEVPAQLTQYKLLMNLLEDKIRQGKEFIIVTGNSGAGKSTALKQVALTAKNRFENTEVFFQNGISNDLHKNLLFLSQEIYSQKKCLIFLSNIRAQRGEMQKILAEGDKTFQNCLFIAEESIGAWEKYTQMLFSASKHTVFNVNKEARLTKDDARSLLKKIEKFGPWHILGKLPSEKDRIDVIFNKSKGQLLIGLLEATKGKGFVEIISTEYREIEKSDDRFFLILASLATYFNHKLPAPLARRAAILSEPKIVLPNEYIPQIPGVVFATQKNQLYARHRLYCEHLIKNIIKKEDLAEAIRAIFKAFSEYDLPFNKSMGTDVYQLYKSIVTKNFFLDVFGGDPTIPLNIFETSVKHLELEPFFWLTFGSLKRTNSDGQGALVCFEKAYEIYKHPVIIHAYYNHLLNLSSKTNDISVSNSYERRAKELHKQAHEDFKLTLLQTAFFLISSLEFTVRNSMKTGSIHIARHAANDAMQKINAIGIKDDAVMRFTNFLGTIIGDTGFQEYDFNLDGDFPR